MKRISVVGTYHKERGNANVPELLAILERIKPEVIFLEIPPAVFDYYLSGPRRNLETTAVLLYAESHDVRLVPVDLPTPEEDFFQNHEHVYERVADMNAEVRRLTGTHSRAVYDYGFAFLNSDQCSALWSHFYEVMQAGINALGDPRLTEHYEAWNRNKALREKAMITNIEDHCQQASFSSAAFLVGAAHRQSIIDLLRTEPGAASSTIQWDFAGFLEEARLTSAQPNEARSG